MAQVGARIGPLRHVRDARHPLNIVNLSGTIRPEVDWFRDFVLLIPEGGEQWRDTAAITQGDDR